MTQNLASQVVSSLSSMQIVCTMGISAEFGIKKLCLKTGYSSKIFVNFADFCV